MIVRHRGAWAIATLVVVLAAGLTSGAPASAPAWAASATPAGVPAGHVGGTPGILLASTFAHGMYASEDDGASWSVLPGFPVTRARIEFVPGDPSTGFVAGFGGVMRTTDGGATWERVLEVARAARIDVSPRGPVLVGARFADTSNHLLVSHDHGDTWADLGAPFPDGVAICGVAFGRTDDEIMIMTDSRSWHTADGGASWTETQGAALDFGIEDSGAVWRLRRLAGLERTLDGGASWQDVPVPGLVIAIGSRPTGGVLVASTVGMLRTDDGAAWDNLGFPNAMSTVHGVSADPADPDAALVADQTWGLARIRADVQGTHFEGLGNGFPPVALDVLTGAGTTLLARGETGLYVTRDGATWSHTGAGLALRTVASAAVAPDGATAMLGGSDLTFAPAVEVSLDGLAHFEVSPLPSATNGTVVAIAIDPADALHAVAVVDLEDVVDGLYETFDGGLSWTATLRLPFAVRDAVYDPSSGALLVATDVGVLARGASGAWVLRGPVLAASAVAVGDVVFAAGPDRLWRDADPAHLLAPWVDVDAVVSLAARGLDTIALLDDGSLRACAGGTLAGECIDASVPGLEVSDVMLVGDRAYAATATGLFVADA